MNSWNYLAKLESLKNYSHSEFIEVYEGEFCFKFGNKFGNINIT